MNGTLEPAVLAVIIIKNKIKESKMKIYIVVEYIDTVDVKPSYLDAFKTREEADKYSEEYDGNSYVIEKEI